MSRQGTIEGEQPSRWNPQRNHQLDLQRSTIIPVRKESKPTLNSICDDSHSPHLFSPNLEAGVDGIKG
jgi:hypothetical protein